MVYIKALLIQVFVPLFYLMFFSYAFALGSIKLLDAWKSKNVKKIWLYLWIMLAGCHFLIIGMIK